MRGGYGDCDGSDSGGAGSAGEARGRATGAWRGRRVWVADSGLSPQEEEFRWLLHDEVHAVLRQLQDILKVTPRRVAVCLFARPPSPASPATAPYPRPAALASQAPAVYATRGVQTGPCPRWTWSLVGGASRQLPDSRNICVSAMGLG